MTRPDMCIQLDPTPQEETTLREMDSPTLSREAETLEKRFPFPDTEIPAIRGQRRAKLIRRILQERE